MGGGPTGGGWVGHGVGQPAGVGWAMGRGWANRRRLGGPWGGGEPTSRGWVGHGVGVGWGFGSILLPCRVQLEKGVQ